MVTIRPLRALRPSVELSAEVSTLPYDVCNTQEAREIATSQNHFYHVTRSEIDFSDDVDPHSQQVYDKAVENLKRMLSEKVLYFDEQPGYFIYQLTMLGRSQTGLICLSSVKDYNENRIKKHEFTRPEKEKDRIDHMNALGAQTGVVFLAYRDVAPMNALVGSVKSMDAPLFDFISDDGVEHKIWAVYNEKTVQNITDIFYQQVPATYIADGHHRAASAAKVAATHADNEAAQYFLTCIFPESELSIWDYNRIIKDLNGLQVNEFIDKVREDFEVEERNSQVKPSKPNQFGMYIDGKWYELNLKEGKADMSHPIKSLDVQILQDLVLTKIVNIDDPRTNNRVEFVGGIRGIGELEKRVNSGKYAAAFSCYPVSLQQLFEVADSGEVMPPKSTWFEPKTRDGLITYVFDMKKYQ